jgi:hypothetical protein
MSIASVGVTPNSAVPISESREGPGPDKAPDHDGDDAHASAAPIQSAPAPGTGLAVDKKA